MTVTHCNCAALAAILAGAALWHAGAIAEEKAPPPRDAAEVVREGDVSQWLEHYRRERDSEWAKQRSAQPPPEPKPAPQPGDNEAGSPPKQ